MGTTRNGVIIFKIKKCLFQGFSTDTIPRKRMVFTKKYLYLKLKSHFFVLKIIRPLRVVPTTILEFKKMKVTIGVGTKSRVFRFIMKILILMLYRFISFNTNYFSHKNIDHLSGSPISYHFLKIHLFDFF